jgi:hypothetical protein
LVVVVVVFSFVTLVPSSLLVTLPDTEVEVVVEGSGAGVVTTVEELAGGGVVVLGTTTVVSLVVVLAGAGVLVVTVRSQPAVKAAPTARIASAGRMFFIGVSKGFRVIGRWIDMHDLCQSI